MFGWIPMAPGVSLSNTGVQAGCDLFLREFGTKPTTLLVSVYEESEAWAVMDVLGIPARDIQVLPVPLPMASWMLCSPRGVVWSSPD